MSLSGMKEKLLDVFFPPRCIICGEVVSKNKPCECIKKLDEIKLPKGAIDFTLDERQHEFITAVWACYNYEEPIKRMIACFKFEDEPELSVPMGDMLYAKYENESLEGKFDFLIESPVSLKTREERGYSQTALLTQQFSRRSGVPVLENILVKTKETEKQTSLSRVGRLTNVQGAFSVNYPEQINGRNICLIDDIITTGSTLQECAKTLHNAGAGAIYAMCVASTSNKRSK